MIHNADFDIISDENDGDDHEMNADDIFENLPIYEEDYSANEETNSTDFY